MKEITSTRLIVLASLFLITFSNLTFFTNILDSYPFSIKNIAFLCSLVIVFGSSLIILFSTICFKLTIKPIITSILLISSATAYFMDSYNVIMDSSMIDNITKTDMAESLDLLSLKLILYILLLGILPSIFVYKLKIVYSTRKNEILSRMKLVIMTFIAMIVATLIFSSSYDSFFRKHKSLHYYANPSFYIYSTIKYVNDLYKNKSTTLKPIGLDAKIHIPHGHRELIIMVLGETARADRFSLNGYQRETNPLLKKENVINFSNFWACGTSTAISVPCMFSIYTQDEFNDANAQSTMNLLDVLQYVGVNVLWIDNNSDSKGVALRVPYVSKRTPKTNPVCDIECRDEGMLVGIQEYIDSRDKGDIFIVLHQMGNHGPAYYKRYPAAFETFKPTCQTNQLEDCTKEEIDNTYDNAILYTDYFLSKTINFLKTNDEKFETGLIYFSDHGESLGEYNTYLHGMPNFIAPKEQLHVPAIMWLGSRYNEMDIEALKKKSANKYSHDNIFHTVLGFMEIQTSIYEPKLDIIHNNE